MSTKGLSISEDAVVQELDLEKLTGKPIGIDEDLVQAIGQEIIDYTVKRTLDGLGVGRKALPSPYSKEYSESLDFKAAGKSPGQVNLKLSGGMLDSIDLLEIDGSTVRIGIEGGEEAVKAFAHQTGFEGHPTIKGAKKRPFIGITQAEFKEYILPKFSSDIESLQANNEPQIQGVINQFRTIGDFFSFEDES